MRESKAEAYCGQNTLEAVSLREELHGELGGKEAEQLDCGSLVKLVKCISLYEAPCKMPGCPAHIVVVICRQTQILEQVVGQGVAQVSTIQLQAKELSDMSVADHRPPTKVHVHSPSRRAR
jgi:hypothetical protein